MNMMTGLGSVPAPTHAVNEFLAYETECRRALKLLLDGLLDVAEAAGWPAATRNSAHSVALNVCKAGIAGEIDPETVRSTFVAFARRNDILVANMDLPMPMVSTGSFSRANTTA